jgi:hypothetical protein
MQHVFQFYEDPGHGWMKVPLTEIKRLGIEPTTYSYMRGDFAYLEEDHDASLFIAAKKARGETFRFNEHVANKSSKIRSYDHYSHARALAQLQNSGK